MSLSISQAVGWTASGERKEYNVSDLSGAQTTLGYPGYKPNENKVVHLLFKKLSPANLLTSNIIDMITSATDKVRVSDRWDNWRDGNSTMSIGGIKVPSVPDNIYPSVESLQINGGFTYGTKTATDILKNGAGAIINTIETAAKTAESISMAAKGIGSVTTQAVKSVPGGVKNLGDMFHGRTVENTFSNKVITDVGRKGTIASRLENFPILDPDSTTAIAPTSIQLEFTLGCGNYFDGEIEVVRPIAAIENTIAPTITDDREMLAPMGSGSQFMALMWGATASALGGVLDAAGNALANVVDVAKPVKQLDGSTSGVNIMGGIQQAVSELGDLGWNVQKNILKSKELAIAALANYTTVLFIRLGNSTVGPFIVEGCNHMFDYSQVDEKGYPYKGTLTLNLKYIFRPTNEDLLSQMGYIVSSPNSSDSTNSGTNNANTASS